MSDFRFACPGCGQRISGDAQYKGKAIVCPHCQHPFTVPSPGAHPTPGSTAASSEPRGVAPFALISVVSALGLGLGSIPAIVFGHLARTRLRRDPALRGRRLATIGLTLGYASLAASLAVVAVAMFVLSPREGRQLTQQEQDANTPEVLAARRVDEWKIRDLRSESEHHLAVQHSQGGYFMDRPVRVAANGGFISLTMQVDPVAPMSLYCTYWGSDSGGRRWDILINDEVIARQVLDYNAPGRFIDVEYPIPRRLTRGRTNVNVVFQAYPRKMVGGIFGCQMLKGMSATP